MPNERRTLEHTLCETLLDSRLDFIARGERSIDEIYESIQDIYPELCDNEYKCPHYGERTTDRPEREHVVRDVLSRLKNETTVIQHLRHGYWFFGEIIEM